MTRRSWTLSTFRFLVALCLGVVLMLATTTTSAPGAAASSNGLLAFDSDRPDGANPVSDVFTMAADGSGATQITPSGGAEPAWNAADTKIAFGTQFSYDESSFSEAVYKMNPDGSEKTLVIDARPRAGTYCRANRNLSWSPDGTKIAIASTLCVLNDSAVHGGVFVVDVATGARPRLTTNRDAFGEDLNPAWSHDGTRIAFARDTTSAPRDTSTG